LVFTVVAWSGDHATLLTEGLLFLGKRETFGQENVAWSGDLATTNPHFGDRH
jgi:hypothetical protein